MELKEEAFAAFADDTPSSSSAAQAGAASPRQQQGRQQEQATEAAPRRGERGPASKRADKLRGEQDTPQRAREAIDRGLQLFSTGQYREAIDMFQLSLEVGACCSLQAARQQLCTQSWGWLEAWQCSGPGGR